MRKFGFTLAEILVTLSIIGVVAALTIPPLMSGSQDQANASKLAATVSNIETAFSNAMTKDRVSDLRETQLFEGLVSFGGSILIDSEDTDHDTLTAFIGKLGQYLAINGYSFNGSGDGTTKYYMNTSGGKGGVTEDYVEDPMVFLKNGATMFLSTAYGTDIETNDAISEGLSLTNGVADIIIDVNGTGQPNTVGRDLFRFVLGQDGVLYPYGGADVAKYRSFNGTWETATDDNGCNSSSMSWGCTARLISNGYKMNY